MFEITEIKYSVSQCLVFRLLFINMFPAAKMTSQSARFLLPVYFRTFSIFKQTFGLLWPNETSLYFWSAVELQL